MSVYITFDGCSGTGKGTIIKALRVFLQERGHSVVIVRDNELDPLRNYSKMMLPWCQEYGIDRNVFLLPLIVVGRALADEKINFHSNPGFILRDRSFISSLGYTPDSAYTQEQVWEVHTKYTDVRVPDMAVIVDAEVEIAMERESKRKQVDKGLGGKMSGNRENREAIRNNFLKIPEIFSANNINCKISKSFKYIYSVIIRNQSL